MFRVFMLNIKRRARKDHEKYEEKIEQGLVKTASQHEASTGTSSRRATWIWSCQKSGP